MNVKAGKRNRDFALAAVYTAAIFASLYFTPFLSRFLEERDLMQGFFFGFYVAFGIFLMILFFYRYRIKHPLAYFFFFLLLAAFLLKFFSMPQLVERFHLLEYAILFGLWFRVFRHFWDGLPRYASTFVFVSMIGLLDERVQGFLPNRYADWNDVGLNIYGASLGIAATIILMRFRRDREPGQS